MSEAVILEFDRVTLGPTWPYDTALEQVSFGLRPGELTLLTLQIGHVRSPFADLTQGLIHPGSGGGEIRCNGHSWRGMSAVEMGRQRSRIGRVFDVGGWISNLDVDENVLLAQRHHNTAPAAALIERAHRLAESFGLPRVPNCRPAEASQHELRVSQWIRALLVDMNLLVLERPTRDVKPECVQPFMDEITRARARGTAVLWITTDGAAANSPHNPAPPDATARYAMQEAAMIK